MIPAHKYLFEGYHDDVHLFGHYQLKCIFIAKSDILELFTFDENVCGLLVEINAHGAINVDATNKMPPTENSGYHIHASRLFKNIETIQLDKTYVEKCIEIYKSLLHTRKQLLELAQIALPNTAFDVAEEKFKLTEKLNIKTESDNLQAQNLLTECIALNPNNVIYHIYLLKFYCGSSNPNVECVKLFVKNILKFNHCNIFDEIGTFKDNPDIVKILKEFIESNNIWDCGYDFTTWRRKHGVKCFLD